VMAVFGEDKRFRVEMRKTNGWFGATATGDFGRVEGWIRTDDVDTIPAGFAAQTGNRRIDICGRSRDGEICLA